MQQTQTGKNATYYELLHENLTWKMSDMLKDKPFLALSPTDKAAILAFICNELLQNKAVIRQIEGSLETVAHSRKEKWLLDAKVRKLRMLHSRKVRTEAVEKAQAKIDGESETAVDSPALHKDDLLDDEENEMSENESVGTQPEEEEDIKLSGEELGKKLEKLLKTSEVQLQALNASCHQLRATCFGQDRYWRRYWTLPKAGGIFVEAMESAEPEQLPEQQKMDEAKKPDITMEDINKMIKHEHNELADMEVSTIVGDDKIKCEDTIFRPDENLDTDDNANEHRKTPNRTMRYVVKLIKTRIFVLNSYDDFSVDRLENGDVLDKRERSLNELRKSVDQMVQSLEQSKQEEKLKETQTNHVEEKMNVDNESISNKKFNLFEKLGECMERENKTEEELKSDVKAEVKEELKNEILNELKTEIKSEIKIEGDEEKNESDIKWFSILNKDGCEGVNLTAGNRWDNGVGVCIRDNLTELKIPVFPPPNSNIIYHTNTCDSPAPLQMTPDESEQLEYIKKHGLPKACERKSAPFSKRFGWWRIIDTQVLREALDNLHVRGARERELKRTFASMMQIMYERPGQLTIEEGQKEATELSLVPHPDVEFLEDGIPCADDLGAWSRGVAQRVDIFLLEQVYEF